MLMVLYSIFTLCICLVFAQMSIYDCGLQYFRLNELKSTYNWPKSSHDSTLQLEKIAEVKLLKKQACLWVFS